MATLAQLQASLAKVETAIDTLVDGLAKTVQVDGRRYEMQDLESLRLWRSELNTEIASKTGGCTNYAAFRRPT